MVADNWAQAQPESKLFARLGCLHSKVTLSGAFGSVSDTDNGLACGMRF